MRKHITKRKTARAPVSLHVMRFIYRSFGRLFPVYFANRAYQQWLTTIRFKTPSHELSAIKTASQESIIINGIPVVVYLWQGENTAADKTLLFIHGWGGRGSQIVNYIEKLNAIGYRVISFDSIAHGKTPGTQTSAFEMTDVVLALDRHYGRFDAAITHSVGGMILAYAISLGLKIDKAAMICPPTDFKILLKNFQRILSLPDNVIQTLNRKSFATHGQNCRDAIETKNNVKDFTCKGLVLHDEDDIEISWHSGEEIAQAWKGAEFIKTKGLGHRRIIHDANVINSIIKFLDDAA